jgi:hypothetical protein
LHVVDGLGVPGVDGAWVSGGCVAPLSTAVSGPYHLSEIFWSPDASGCTPSVVSALVLKPVHWSTTVIGDAAVVLPAAQPGMAWFSATTRCPHSAQLDGFIGMICATRIFMLGLLARI